MSFDVQPGQQYTPTLTFYDGNGSPITTGIVGTMTLYAPDSTTAVSGPTSLSHQGGGRWGVTFAGSLTAALGTYRWASSAITGTATLGAQYGSFVVGLGDAWTLREIYTRVRLMLPDGWLGTTSGDGTTTSIVCAKYAYGSDNAWLSSELYFFEPGAVGDENPVRVTDFDAATGTFTFTPIITDTVAGLDFIIGNKDGMRFEHDRVMEAIRGAVRRAGLVRAVTDRVSLATVSNQYLYSLPNGWIGLDGVDYLLPGGQTDDWRPVSNVYLNRQHLATDGVFGLALGWGGGLSLRLRGKAAPTIPDAMGGYVAGDGATIADDALYELLLMSTDGPDRQRAAALQPSVLRARAGVSLARL